MKANVSPASLDVYTNMRESGELSTRRYEVIEVLTRWSNLSCHQICAEVNKKFKHTYPSSVAGRLNELVSMGLVDQSHALSKCGVTGRRVHKYRLNKPVARAA